MAGLVFHVINRGVRRQPLFATADDYLRFQDLIVDARTRWSLPFYCYSLMPNHFHFVVHPANDAQLPKFMQWLCSTRAKRFNLERQNVGAGAVYQARYHAFAVQTDRHFLTVCRYVERNPLRARLVARAEDWPWSSLGQNREICHVVPLEPWPVPRPPDWIDQVNRIATVAEESAIRECLRWNRPYGDCEWVETTSGQLGLSQPAVTVAQEPNSGSVEV
jgi:putative transposase